MDTYFNRLEPAPPEHGRTPDNTPIPGGGRWTWDEVAGTWLSLDPAPAAPVVIPATQE